MKVSDESARNFYLEDNPPIGIVLCAEKSNTVVEILSSETMFGSVKMQSFFPAFILETERSSAQTAW